MSETLVNVVTPVGELYYVNISGQGKENYNEDGYEYVASVRLEGEEAKKLIALIDEEAEKMPDGKILKSKGYKQLVKSEEGTLRSPTVSKPKQPDEEDSGIFEFQFKTGTTFADGKPKKINVYNANAEKINLGDRRIGNGSIGAISGKMRGKVYKKEFSVSLFLNAIQLVKFIEYTEDAGFEAQEAEDGFVGVEDKETGFTGQPEEVQEEKKTKAKPKL